MTLHDQQTAGDGVLLPGLDGANPLGFLAALGVFRCLSTADSGQTARMSWTTHGSSWRPVVHSTRESPMSPGEILQRLDKQLVKQLEEHDLHILTNISVDDRDARRDVFRQRLASSTNDCRASVDALAAIASDIAPSEVVCQLQTTRRDYHLQNLNSVIQHANVSHLERSLFREWDYADPLDNHSLHLDPTEDRRHAYQWDRPSGDPNRKKRGGMLGANRLAIEALPLFTSFPKDDSLSTLGFSGRRSDDTNWTWPIWNRAISLPCTISLLSLADLQLAEPSREQATLKAMGIVAVYRTRRILVQKTPNFTPPLRIA